MAEKPQKDEMIFEQARLAYPGRKRGFQVEWDYFRRVVRNWKTVIPLLGPAIERQAKERELLKSKGEFCPAWKDFKSWLLNHYWELSTPELDNQTKKKKQNTCCICGKPATMMVSGRDYCSSKCRKEALGW